MKEGRGLKVASKMVELEKDNGGNKDHGSELGITINGVLESCLLEVLEGIMRQKSLWKVVP